MKQFFSILFLLTTIITLPAEPSAGTYNGWLETETEHYKIIYEEISTASVLEIIGFCEDVYKSVTTFFDSYPEKIIIVVHDRIDTANGSYNPVPPHINMYVSPPSTTDFGAKIDNWLRFLLTHELTHYVNMNIEEGMFYQLSRVMGKSVSSIPGGLMPGWAIEGIAVKLESDLTGGGRGNNPFFEMYSKALIIEDRLFTWKQAAYSSYHPPLSRIYIAGYIINDYMAHTYGNDIFIRIYRAYLKFPLLGFNHYVKKITGNSTRAIFSAMEFELKKKYSNTNSFSGRLLSPDEESNYYLPVITDAGWIVYRDTADKEPALVLINPDSRKETILIKTKLSDYKSFSASKDGERVVFAALDIDGKHPAGLSTVSDLYIFHSDKNRTKKITFNAHLRQPALSPDGSQLIAVQKSGQYTCLVEIDIETGTVKTLFKKEKSFVFSPVFSTNGENIAFTIQDNGERSIRTLNNKQILKSISSDIPGDDYAPSFRENGNIVYVSDMDGSPALYEINLSETDTANTGEIIKIHMDPVGIFSGLVSGDEIIYSTYSHRGYTLKAVSYPKESINHIEYYYEKDKTNSIEFENIGYSENNKITNPIEFGNNIPLYNNYTDTPKLIVFSPLPFYIDPLYESDQIFGPGFSGYWQSILGKNIIYTTVTMNTETLQPGASFDFSYDWGPVGVNYTLMQGYLPASGSYKAKQTTQQKIILTLPVISRNNLGKSTYFGFFSGIRDNFSIISDMDFTFFAPDTEANSEYSNDAYFINGIRFSSVGSRSSRDLIPPFKITSSTTLYNPLSPDFLKQYAVKSINLINLPSLIDHQVIRLAGRLSYSTIDDLTHLNNPRGFNIKKGKGIQLITAADYLFTMAATDLPVLGGLSLQGISGAVYVEKVFRLENQSIEADDYLYSGVELILLGNYINFFESAGIGFNYRFEPGNTEYNPENLGIYIFIGTNSFE